MANTCSRIAGHPFEIADFCDIFLSCSLVCLSLVGAVNSTADLDQGFRQTLQGISIATVALGTLVVGTMLFRSFVSIYRFGRALNLIRYI